MLTVDMISAMSMTLLAGGNQCLYIQLDSHGSIARQGTGLFDNDDYDMYIGNTGRNLLRQLTYGISDELLQQAGSYTAPDRQGEPCTLTIHFSGEGEEVTLEYNYGSQSAGPPEEVADLVLASIQITQSWYDDQKQAQQ